jgi:ribosomal-protein-alanine N-acetyltransferase
MRHFQGSASGSSLPDQSTTVAKMRWQFRFRKMTLEDIPQVHTIDILSFNMPWPEKSYQFELTQNPNGILWVVEALPDKPGAPSRLAGMIVIWFIVDEAHVATLAIHPDFRGLGLSKKLLAVGLRDAIQRGAVESTLEVRASNQAAQKLYQGFGYQIVGQRPRYYRDNNEDALLMTVSNLGPDYDAWLKQMIEEQPT